jgi:5-methylcytosine-specific restriction protein B
MTNAYPWVPFYEALADKLLEYRNKRNEFFELIKKVSSEQPLMKYFHFEREDWWGQRNHQIDPFSVIGIINRNISAANRTTLAKVLSDNFNIQHPAPTQFNGIPVMDNRKSLFEGPDEIWDLFIFAMESAKTKVFSDEFKRAFEQAISVNGNGLTNITMGLFWIRPTVFMPLDGNSRDFISSNYGITVPGRNCTGDEYVKILESLKKKFGNQSIGNSFPELSYRAWNEKAIETRAETILPSTGSINVEMKETTLFEPSQNLAKNIILYGTPGTGKTYSTVLYAVAIIEEKPLNQIKAEEYSAVFERYQKYKAEGLVSFTTFHQSYGYEEFIEGIRPVISNEENAETMKEIKYEICDGVFKSFCDKAETPIGNGQSVDLGIGKNPTVWKVSLEKTGDNPTRTECMEKNHIRIGWDEYGETISDTTDFSKYGGSAVLNAFYNRMQIGDIVMSCYSSKTIDAIGVITGEPEWHDDYPYYKRLRKVNWLVKGINEDIVDLNAGKTMTLSSVYKLSVSVSDVFQILRKVKPSLLTENYKIPNRVFIIDEINRGNISKIFGELISLIEPSKRIGAREELRAILPYSGKPFGVPENVYIIGTMNTADRSIALIDTALRRRFHFVELQPDSSLLTGVLVNGIIDISKMLDTLNKRITVLLDREHTIGHSYLLPLKDAPTIENLASIFENSIVPLLKEYFYDDYEKIQLVLGDNQKQDDRIRFIVKRSDAIKLFGTVDIDFPDYFEINSEAFKRIDAYAFIQ